MEKDDSNLRLWLPTITFFLGIAVGGGVLMSYFSWMCA